MARVANSVAVLEVRLLGAPVVQTPTGPLQVDTRKALALLAYLAMTARPARRDSLAGLLWPEYDQNRARAALRRTLSTLRSGLGGPWVTVDGELIALERGDVRIDVDEFRDAAGGCPKHRQAPEVHCPACVKRLRSAAEIYTGDFMEGFALRDAVDFDDWQFFESNELRRELSAVLELLSGVASTEAAITFARRWLALDELNETAHRRLMELYADSGQRTAALRQYRRCVAVMEAELSVAPLDSTTDLYESIVSERSRPQPSKKTTAIPAPAVLPMVGRDAQKAEAKGALNDSKVLVVEGEAGAGKTRLVSEVMATVDGPVMAARCYGDESHVAYAPLASLLREVTSAVAGLPASALNEVSRLVPHLQTDDAGLGDLNSPGAQTRFFEAILEVLVEAARPHIFLVLDDLQWIDDASLALLAFLLRRAPADAVRFALIWRTGQTDSHITKVVDDARREGRVVTVTCGRLERDDVAELAAGELSDAEFERLWVESEGLALFCVEYLQAMRSGVVVDEMPRGVQDLIRSRLSGLNDVTKQILDAAAVVGRPFDVETVREASGRSDDEAAFALDDLVRRRLVVESDSSYDLAHDKIRAVVCEDAGLARRRLLHRRVAEALVSRLRAGRDVPAAAIAGHFQSAGVDESAAEWFAVSGRRARSLYAHVEALSDLSSALALGHPDAAELHRERGDVHTMLGDYSAACADFEAAISLGGPVAVLEHKLGRVCERRGDHQLADSHLRSALESAAGDAALRSRVLSDLSLVAHRLGNNTEAERFATESIELAQGDSRALAQALNILGILAADAGDADAAIAHLERSLSLGADLDDPQAQVAAMNNLALVLRGQRDFDGAIAWTQKALSVCEKTGDIHRQAALHSNLADLFHAVGEVAQSEAQQLRSVSLFVQIGSSRESAEVWKLVDW